jgi:hypothetical protein
MGLNHSTWPAIVHPACVEPAREDAMRLAALVRSGKWNHAQASRMSFSWHHLFSLHGCQRQMRIAVRKSDGEQI